MNAPADPPVDVAACRTHGWTALSHPIPAELVQPLLHAAKTLAVRPPHQALLSGAHNPFGRAAALFDAWKFLDVCEAPVLLDAVAALIGPDVVLWDSELYLQADAWNSARSSEGRYWPVDPLAGVIADIALAGGRCVLADVKAAGAVPGVAPGAHYVIRYMPATSRYNRDPLHQANRIAMEERPLVNYLNRPIWLVRGEDRAGNDFATGFAPATPAWAADDALENMGV
ncbi:MAG: resolvase [Betaproteobacteria bacterium]